MKMPSMNLVLLLLRRKQGILKKRHFLRVGFVKMILLLVKSFMFTLMTANLNGNVQLLEVLFHKLKNKNNSCRSPMFLQFLL
jgi:hypothetical protein